MVAGGGLDEVVVVELCDELIEVVGVRRHPLAQGFAPEHESPPQRFQERLAGFKVNDRVATLTRAYREAPAAQKSTIREQLKPLLEQQFQSRQQREKEHLRRLKEMTQKMEARIQEREARKAEIIQHHLEELTTGQELRW